MKKKLSALNILSKSVWKKITGGTNYLSPKLLVNHKRSMNGNAAMDMDRRVTEPYNSEKKAESIGLSYMNTTTSN